MNKRLFWILSVFLIMALMLAACAGEGETVGTIPTTPADTVAESADANPTETPAPTATPDQVATLIAQNARQTAAIATQQAQINAMATQAAATPVPPPTATPSPTATPVDNDDFMTDASCIVLPGEERPIGTACFPRDASVPDYVVPVAEAGFSFAALGTGEFDGESLSPVAEDVGHIVLFLGSEPDGSTPKDLNKGVELSDYIPGAVGITHITWPTSYDDAIDEVRQHAVDMTKDAPGCGAEACNTVYYWLWDWDKGDYVLIEKIEKSDNS